MLMVTRKDAMLRGGVTNGMWRRARKTGELRPTCEKLYERPRFFLETEVRRVFGLPEGWERDR